jgi:CRP-like cAMP-binding protein
VGDDDAKAVLVARLEQVCEYLDEDRHSFTKYQKERVDLFAVLHDNYGMTLEALAEVAGVTKAAVLRALQRRAKREERDANN